MADRVHWCAKKHAAEQGVELGGWCECHNLAPSANIQNKVPGSERERERERDGQRCHTCTRSDSKPPRCDQRRANAVECCRSTDKSLFQRGTAIQSDHQIAIRSISPNRIARHKNQNKKRNCSAAFDTGARQCGTRNNENQRKSIASSWRTMREKCDSGDSEAPCRPSRKTKWTETRHDNQKRATQARCWEQ